MPCMARSATALGGAAKFATRQLFTASVLGPAMGGVMLTAFGPWIAFGTAAVIEIAAIVPLLRISEPPFERVAPPGGYAAAQAGVLLFATDGLHNNSAVMAWNLIMFQSLDAFFQIDKRTRRRIGVLLLVGNAFFMGDLPQPIGIIG
jgi:hypothetical protein